MAGQYSVANDAVLEVGKVYDVRHSRKGNFRFRVTAINDEWISGVVVSGVANAMMACNVSYEGDDLTIRDVHSHFAPVAEK